MQFSWLLGCGALLVIGLGLGRYYLVEPEATAESLGGAIAQASYANLPAPPPFLDDLTQASVVYLAETHTDPADHIAQLSLIQALQEQRGDIAIGLEMIQRPFQPVLDRYISGEITEAELVEQTQYERRWGYSWELYAPIFRYAQSQGIPLLALNTPTEITRQVAREGLNSLEPEAFTYIPPLEEIDTTNTDYQAVVAEVFSFHGGHGNSGPSFENFFAAQVLWDETMADRVASYLTENPDDQVVVLAGEGHILQGYGIPDRVQRRFDNSLTTYSVLLNSDIQDPEAADFFWSLPPISVPES